MFKNPPAQVFSAATDDITGYLFIYFIYFFYFLFFIFYFLSALLDIHIKGYILLYKQRKLQGIRPMGLAQTGQRDPCKAPPLKMTLAFRWP
jgi:hypothetical protein